MQLFMKTSVVSVINVEKKHVLCTASTAGSLCFFIFEVQLPGQTSQSIIKNVLDASTVSLNPRSSSFIVPKTKIIYCDYISLHSFIYKDATVEEHGRVVIFPVAHNKKTGIK